MIFGGVSVPFKPVSISPAGELLFAIQPSVGPLAPVRLLPVEARGRLVFEFLGVPGIAAHRARCYRTSRRPIGPRLGYRCSPSDDTPP